MERNYKNRYDMISAIKIYDRPGVFFSELSRKWVVRIRKSNGHFKTIAQFDSENEARLKYKLETKVISNK